MKHYQYIIVGGGMTGSAAVMAIRKNDPDGSIAMFSKESYQPYNRPPLSKSIWEGMAIDDIQRSMDKYNTDLFLNSVITKINSSEKWISSDNGDQFQYQKLLLATGGDPIRLPSSPQDVIYYRTRADYHRLEKLAKEKNDFCVIGGGFIGSEIAAALSKQGKKVTMLFPEKGISGARFPDELAEFLNDYYREHEIKVLAGHLVKNIEKTKDNYKISFHPVGVEDIQNQSFDGVIAGIGIQPNVQLAKDAGVEVVDGIAVNEYLQTNLQDIYAAGDVAYFHHFGLGKKVRVEHEDNANTMGKTAGINMAGKMEKFDHFPMFYSDLFDLGYEAIGEINKDYQVYSDWIEPFKKGTIFYLDNDKIRGLIFWNLWDKVDQGREIIREGASFGKADLAGMFSE